MDNQIKVETSFTESGLIEQTIDIAGSIQRRVMNTADEAIKLSLIAMGWTAPGEGIEHRSSGMTIDVVDEDGGVTEDQFEHVTHMPGAVERQERKPAPKKPQRARTPS